jgi:hypothetical protein
MITDPWVKSLFIPPKWGEYGVMAFFALFVCLLSKWVIASRRRKAALEGPLALVED